jgi:hypothetical protein
MVVEPGNVPDEPSGLDVICEVVCVDEEAIEEDDCGVMENELAPGEFV